jgi:hypothetical protein
MFYAHFASLLYTTLFNMSQVKISDGIPMPARYFRLEIVIRPLQRAELMPLASYNSTGTQILISMLNWQLFYI